MFLNINDINPKLKNLIAVIQKDHGDLYIVGGLVRDLIINNNTSLNLAVNDIDIEVYNLNFNRLIEILKNYNYNFILQKNFGVIMLTDLNTEITIPREENKIGSKHGDFEIFLDPTLTLKKAAKRRDFTINSIMYDLQSNKLIDNWNGIYDIKEKKLRHISDKFLEDPLRILRGLRLSSQLGFDIEKNTLKKCIEGLDELKYISIQRKNIEFDKFFLGDFIKVGLKYYEILILKYFKLEELKVTKQNPEFHPEIYVWEHIKQSILALNFKKELFEENDFLILSYTLMFHDVGKIDKYSKNLKIDNIIDHSLKSYEISKYLLPSILNSKKQKKIILSLILDHMKPMNFHKMKSEDIIELYYKYKNNINLLLYVHTFDKASRSKDCSMDEIQNNVNRLIETFFQKYSNMFKYIKEIDKKYNGKFFLNQNIEAKNIKSEKILFMSNKLDKYLKI